MTLCQNRNWWYIKYYQVLCYGVNECSKLDNQYIEYIFYDYRFYLEANGFYAKISDFGTTFINRRFKFNDILSGKKIFKNKRNDVFIFLRDLYDGQCLGANSILEIMKKHKIKKQYVERIKSIINKFIPVKKLDKMNSINKQLIDGQWSTNKYPFLKNMVKKPEQYIKSSIFKSYQMLPKNGRIIMSFGDRY